MIKNVRPLLAASIIFFAIQSNAASPVEDFFGKLGGTWNAQSSQDIGFREDGTVWRNWQMDKHVTRIEGTKGQWEILSFFCTTSPGNEMCSDSRVLLRLARKKLFVVFPDDSMDEIPVEILSSSPSGLVMRFSAAKRSVTYTHKLSPTGIWSQVIQVYEEDHLSAVQTVTSKRAVE